MNECSPVTRRTNTGVGAHRARCHPSPAPPTSLAANRARAQPEPRECIGDDDAHVRTHTSLVYDARTRVNTESWLIHGGAQVRSFLHSVLPVRSFMPEPHALTGSSPRESSSRERERLPPPPPPSSSPRRASRLDQISFSARSTPPSSSSSGR